MYDGLDLDGDRSCPAPVQAELSPPGNLFVVGSASTGRRGAAAAASSASTIGRCLRSRRCTWCRSFAAEGGRAAAAARTRGPRAGALGYSPVARLDTGPKQVSARGLYESEGYIEVPDFNGNPVRTVLLGREADLADRRRCPAQAAARLEDPDLGVVADQEPVRAGLALVAADLHVASKQRGLHPPRRGCGPPGSRPAARIECSTSAFSITHPSPTHGRVGADVAVGELCSSADDRRPAHRAGARASRPARSPP